MAGVDEIPAGDEVLFGPGTRSAGALRLVGPAMHRAMTRAPAKAVHGWGMRRSMGRALAPDVGHIHWIGTGWELTGFEAARQAARRGVPFTVWPAIHAGVWGDSPLDFTLYRAADAVFAQSEHERSVLLRGGVLDDRIHVTGLAPSVSADGDGRRFRAGHGLADAPLVLFIGRRGAYKGSGVLRDSLEEVWREQPDARLVLCGPGEVPGGIRADPRILDLGRVTEGTKADALAAADILCIPSLFEAFGIVYVEAWSHGVPVVGGPAPAVKELIRDGVDGLLVEQTSGSVARALLRLIGDAQLRRRMGAAGLKRQRESFTWAHVARRHDYVFTAVSAARGASGAPVSGARA